MNRSRLQLPLRLAREALDRARADLVAAAERRQSIERALEDTRTARAHEGFEDASGLQPLASYVERSRRLERDLRERQIGAEAEEAACLEAVRARRLEVRRLELLDKRLARAERLAASRREQRDLDAFVLLQAARRRETEVS